MNHLRMLAAVLAAAGSGHAAGANLYGTALDKNPDANGHLSLPNERPRLGTDSITGGLKPPHVELRTPDRTTPPPAAKASQGHKTAQKPEGTP